VRFTVFEQGLYAIREQADAAGPCFARDSIPSVLKLGERIGVQIATWQSPSTIRFNQYVGVVRQGELLIEMLPKLDALPAPTQVRHALLAMLAEVYDLDVRSSELTTFLEVNEPFSVALARLYSTRLSEAVRRGLRNDYVTQEELLPYLRGKVNWSTYAKMQVSRRLEFPCRFDERSADIPLNRILKAALNRVTAMLDRGRSASIVTELRHAMSDVSDIRPSAELLSQVRTDRMSRHLEPLSNLAKLILRNAAPDEYGAPQSRRATYALAWDMNVLFEEYVGRIAMRILARTGWDVVLQDANLHLAVATATRRPAFLLKPDIVVRSEGRPVVVADTKWKRLDVTASHLGVSQIDVYQLLAYAERYKVERAYLIYPHQPLLGLPGIKREFDTQSGVRLGIATLDLARLDDVESGIQRILGDSARVAA
jgi:5-methylcytosine-specific restriction enzyme subunit McrC